ncbi:MAG TPA: ABC transporter permease [Candidatus Angelobacter sp.]|jgi:peptide/nickel transport system permease protein
MTLTWVGVSDSERRDARSIREGRSSSKDARSPEKAGVGGAVPFKITWAIWFLLTIHVAIVLAGFIAPYNYETQEREHAYAPPTKIHFIDCAGKFHLRAFVYVTKPAENDLNQYQQDCSQPAPIEFFARGDEYSILGFFHSTRHFFGVQSPASLFMIGTDGFGRDLFSRLLYGGQVSLFAGFVAAAFSVVTGLLLGGIAGMYGGRVDDVAMRVAEVFITVPWFYLLIAVRAFLPLQISPVTAFLLVVSVIGLVGWGRPARLVRGVILSARERNFVLAARGFGASNAYLLRRHLMPLTFRVLLTQMAVLIPQFILAEVILSFLGLGIGEPFPSWGNMLANAQQYHVLVSYWWMLLPGLAPVPVFLAYHSLAETLQERTKSNF